MSKFNKSQLDVQRDKNILNMDTIVIAVEKTNKEDEYYYDREYYKDDVRCGVPYCKKPRRDNRTKQYFTVPSKLKEMFCQMLEKDIPNRYLHVCEDHISITDDCYRTETGVLRLKDTASFPLIRKQTSGNVGVVQPEDQTFKYCSVPDCNNSIINAPDKVFFPIPKGVAVRKKWSLAMKRGMMRPLIPLYCCEDHFNIEEDTENYVHYSMMTLHGSKKLRLLLKRGVVPHKFQCQKDTLSPERKDFKRRKHLDTIEEAPGDDPLPAKQSISPAKISGSLLRLLFQENTEIAETSLQPIQEMDKLDPLITDENHEEVDTTATKVKLELEDNDNDVSQEHFDTALKEEKCDPVISVEQFLKGCEFYLTPELANYVKTQIKQCS